MAVFRAVEGRPFAEPASGPVAGPQSAAIWRSNGPPGTRGVYRFFVPDPHRPWSRSFRRQDAVSRRPARVPSSALTDLCFAVGLAISSGTLPQAWRRAGTDSPQMAAERPGETRSQMPASSAGDGRGPRLRSGPRSAEKTAKWRGVFVRVGAPGTSSGIARRTGSDALPRTDGGTRAPFRWTCRAVRPAQCLRRRVPVRLPGDETLARSWLRMGRASAEAWPSSRHQTSGKGM